MYPRAMPRLVAGKPGARKFWHGWVGGTELTVKFGKLGTAGTLQTKAFDSPERAARELDKLVKQKIAKGYADDRWTFDFDSGLAVAEVVDLPPRERHPKKASFTAVGEPAGDVRGRVIAGEVAMILRAAGAATVVELYTKRGDVWALASMVPAARQDVLYSFADGRGVLVGFSPDAPYDQATRSWPNAHFCAVDPRGLRVLGTFQMAVTSCWEHEGRSYYATNAIGVVEITGFDVAVAKVGDAFATSLP